MRICGSWTLFLMLFFAMLHCFYPSTYGIFRFVRGLFFNWNIHTSILIANEVKIINRVAYQC